MSDCGCNNFPASLGNVTFGARVGIGTLSPTRDLDVYHNADTGNGVPVAVIRNNAPSNGSILELTAASGGDPATNDKFTGLLINEPTGRFIQGWTSPTTKVFEIGTGGSAYFGSAVTIGAPLALATLDLYGAAALRGNVTINGPRPWADVRAYGAAGDGVVNDFAALSDAIDAAIANNSDVLLPAGTYKINSALSKTVAAGALLRIVGMGTVTIVTTGISEPGAEAGLLQFGAGDANSRIEIENVVVSHGATAVGIRNGIQLTGFKESTLRRVTVTKASLWGVKLVNCLGGLVEVTNCDDNRYGGIGLHGCQNIVVSGGSYSSNGTSAPLDGYGVVCASGTASRNIVITGVKANSNLRHGIDVHAGQNIKIHNNQIVGFGTAPRTGTSVAAAGIYAVNQGTSKDVRDITITANYIDGMGASTDFPIYAIEIGADYDPPSTPATDSGTFLIANNIVRNLKHHSGDVSILVYNPPSSYGPAPSNVVIANNTITDGSGSGEYIVHFSNNVNQYGSVVLTGNVLHSPAGAGGAVLQEVLRAAVNDNVLLIDGGSPAWGFYASASVPVDVTMTGNVVRAPGLNTGTVLYPNEVYRTAAARRGNTLNGVAIEDRGSVGMALTGAVRFQDPDGSELRAHRHPYSGQRHIETFAGSFGSIPASTPAATSLTFTNPFASTPTVVYSLGYVTGQVPGRHWTVGTSTTGTSVYVYTDAGAATVDYAVIAEGAD